MLDFFRRYQRYLYVLITIVIVISFSFFGTFSAMSDGSYREQIAFKKVDGTDVTRRELDEMVVFIGTDTDDKQLYGGVWGPNFLNDGVVKNNILSNGLGTILISSYANEMRQDYIARLDKEQRYNLYSHPKAKFVGVESAWSYFSPEMLNNFNVMRRASDPLTQDAVHARIALFLMERQFPPSLLRRVLQSQQNQYSWLAPDRNLDYIDLSLFGYHTMEDWFGPRFSRLVAQFIMNAAVIAEQRGYYVSKADAMGELMANAESSYRLNVRNPKLGVTSSQEYFDEQLRRLGMDRTMAARVWQQVMLFRRLFQDMGDSVFVDPQTFEQFDSYALASVEGQLYQLPVALRLNSYQALQQFETYLNAVSKRTDDEKNKLMLPQTFLTAAEVSKSAPGLVQKRYLLEVAHVDKKAIETNVGVKESWTWETSDAGWEKLKKQFPELGLKSGVSSNERNDALDALDDKTRGRVDAFARSSIVDAHPEWIDNALLAAEPVRQTVGLHEKGGNTSFAGLEDGKALMTLLDAAPLASQSMDLHKGVAKDAAQKLSHFTADQNVYYRITVIDRAKDPEVLTFAEAEKQGVLSKLLDANLEAYYIKIRESSPKEFQSNDKSWKPLVEVRDAVADRYFEKVLKSIGSSYAAAIAPEVAPQQMIGDYAATLRLFPYMRDVKAKLQKDPKTALTLVRSEDTSEKIVDSLPPVRKLSDQWKLEMLVHRETRSTGNGLLNKKEVFALNDGDWTKVNTPANGDLSFFHLDKKGTNMGADTVAMSMNQVKRVLSNSAQQQLMRQIMEQIDKDKAMSLEYLNVQQ